MHTPHCCWCCPPCVMLLRFAAATVVHAWLLTCAPPDASPPLSSSLRRDGGCGHCLRLQQSCEAGAQDGHRGPRAAAEPGGWAGWLPCTINTWVSLALQRPARGQATLRCMFPTLCLLGCISQPNRLLAACWARSMQMCELLRGEAAMAGFTEILTWALCSHNENFEALRRVRA